MDENERTCVSIAELNEFFFLVFAFEPFSTCYRFVLRVLCVEYLKFYIALTTLVWI